MKALFNPKLYLFLAIFFAPLRSYRIGSIFGFNVSLFRFFVILTIYILILWLLYNKKIFFLSRKLGLIFFFIISLSLILIISYIRIIDYYGIDTKTRFLTKIFGLLLILFFLFFLSKEKNIQLAVQIFLLSSIIPLLIGTYQLLYFLKNSAFPLLPLSKFLVISDISAKGAGILYWKYPRLTSTFLEPNYFGMFLVAVILISLCLLTSKATKKRFLSHYLLLIIIILSSLLLAFTLSLSAFSGLLIGLSILLIKGEKKKIGKYLILILFALFIINYAFTFFFDMNIYKNVSGRITLKMPSYPDLWGRKMFFKSSIAAFRDNPLLGVGFGTLTLYTGIDIPSAHNSFLTFLAEEGLIGFSLLIAFLIYVFRKIYKKQLYFQQVNSYMMSSIGIGLLSSFLALFISNQFYDAMFSFDSSWVLIAIFTSYAVLPVNRERLT